MAGEIGDWTLEQLTKFVQQLIENSEAGTTTRRTFDEVVITRKLTINDEQQFTQGQSTVGAAGSASALPATPAGYIKILDPTGSVKLVPYYLTP